MESISSGTTQRFELLTHKRYVFEPNGFVPEGLTFRPMLGDETDQATYGSDGVEIVVKINGRVSVEHYLINTLGIETGLNYVDVEFFD